MTAPALARPRFFERAAGVSDSTRWLGPLMLAPAVLYIGLVVAVPFLMAIGYSFSSVTIGTSTPRFVGLENFRSALQDPAFLEQLLPAGIRMTLAEGDRKNQDVKLTVR